jgi:FkbM family methyltransferase
MIRALIDRWFIKNPRLRRVVTRLIEGDETKEVEILGLPLAINTVREHGYLRASRAAAWSALWRDEASVLLALSALIGRVDAFVDVGANVGLFSATMSRFQSVFPKLKIWAFEADPDTFGRLSQNVAGQGRTVHQIAIAEEPGQVRFVRGAVSHVTTREEHANDYSLRESFVTAAQRLDAFDVPGDRLLLKIDVEDQELATLFSAQSWFDEGRVVAVFIDGSAKPLEVQEFLKQRDFVFRDARTMLPAHTHTFALLALRNDWLASFATTTA